MSHNSDPTITNSEVIPEIESRLFADNPEAHLAVGIVAVGNNIVPGFEDEYTGYALLRGNVYAWQKGYMPVDELNEDGTETDADDARSVHFAVIENALTHARVIGGMRQVIKSPEDDRPLPIESLYPEAFLDAPAPMYSTETSRLISRHENPRVQNGVKWLLFTAGVTYVTKHDLGPVYGVVEPILGRGLRMEGVPVTDLAPPKFVPQINSTKMPIRVDVASLAQKLEGERPDLLNAMQTLQNEFVYSGRVKPTSSNGESVA